MTQRQQLEHVLSCITIVLDVRFGGSRDPGQRCSPALSHPVLCGRHGPRGPLARRQPPHLFHIRLGYQNPVSLTLSIPNKISKWRRNGGGERKGHVVFVCDYVLLILNDLMMDPPVVSQEYDTDVNKEYVIRANSALLKCQFPSFMADYLQVESWIIDDGTVVIQSDLYGTPSTPS